MPERSPLAEELIRRIRARGTIPFAEFMQAALYHPEHGYYNSGRPAGGLDFRTSPQVHRGFGELLARQVEEMWRCLGAGPFRIVELGPGDGALARAFLAALPQGAGWEYHLVETSPALRQAQQERLSALPPAVRARVFWSDAGRLAAEPHDGVILSNEFFDALPVRPVRWAGGRLHEVHVGFEPETGFVEQLEPVPDGDLQDHLRRYGAPLREGQRAEIGLEALAWVDRIAAMLARGWAITIDYGDTAEGLFAPRRSAGTLLAYRDHRAEADVLARPGEQDLTAHVNFTALARRGEERGLRASRLRTQTEFLVALGAVDRVAAIDAASTSEAGRWTDHFGWKELFAPGGMGETFRVLIQAKGAPLEGLRGLSSPWSDAALTRAGAGSSVPSQRSG